MTYLVESIKSQEGRTTKAGKPFTKFLLTLKEEGDVPFADFDGLDPQPGQTLEGYEITTHPQFGKELKKAGSGNGRPKSFGKSPEQEKSIRRQSAQQRAALFLIAKALMKGQDVDLTWPDFKKLVDGVEADADG